MTIHSDWSRILHEECPQAFLGAVPRGRHAVGFVDGHLQLMRLHAGQPSWDAFVQSQFVQPLRSLLDAGCPVVVLCFDSYDSVPLYKSMTQGARASRHEVKVFMPHQELPANIPEEPMLYLMNRVFKVKLIDMLCARVPAMLELKPGQRLILDYKRVVEYTGRGEPPVTVEGLSPMGESDVKFCRYVERFGNALVHAIDGDYMAIALLYYTKYGMRPDANRIFLYRQLATLPPCAAERRSAEASSRKRAKPDARAKPKKCWVDMQLLYGVIARSVWMSVGGARPLNVETRAAFTDADAVASAVFLMLLAGTDFSRSLPQVGPKRMWEALPDVAAPLLQAVRGGAEVDQAFLADGVIAQLYCSVYEKHVDAMPRAERARLASVLGVLSRTGSKLSATTRARLPSLERVAVTVRNLVWVTLYWTTVDGSVETPTDGRYGFLLADAPGASAPVVRFADDAAVPLL